LWQWLLQYWAAVPLSSCHIEAGPSHTQMSTCHTPNSYAHVYLSHSQLTCTHTPNSHAPNYCPHHPPGFWNHSYDANTGTLKNSSVIDGSRADKFLAFLDSRSTRSHASDMVAYLREGAFLDSQTQVCAPANVHVCLRVVFCKLYIMYRWSCMLYCIWFITYVYVWVHVQANA